MKYNVICKKFDLAESNREKLLKKFRKIDKFFDDENECKIVISTQREEIIVEFTILYKGYLLRAEARNKDLMTSADICMENLDRQIRKNKTKLAKRIKESGFENYIPVMSEDVNEDKDDFKIIRKKHIESKPMAAEEAVLQMNMLGHDFFVFTDPDTNDVSIVYKRKDGNYGLIETN